MAPVYGSLLSFVNDVRVGTPIQIAPSEVGWVKLFRWWKIEDRGTVKIECQLRIGSHGNGVSFTMNFGTRICRLAQRWLIRAGLTWHLLTFAWTLPTREAASAKSPCFLQQQFLLCPLLLQWQHEDITGTVGLQILKIIIVFLLNQGRSAIVNRSVSMSALNDPGESSAHWWWAFLV